MKIELSGMSHLSDPDNAMMFTGKMRLVLTEEDTPLAELHVSDQESGATRVILYSDPKQIQVVVDLVRAIHTTHVTFGVPVAVG